MCWGVCITRRGMVYFGASIHIFVTLILFVGSSIRAFHLSTYDREDSRKEILGGTVIATYFFVLFMLGLLIFRATEQKNPKLLGWTGGTFITLETFAFVFNLLLMSPVGGAYDEYGIRNFGFTMNLFHIVISCVFLFFMMAYCATIIMYISKLKEERLSHPSHSTTYGDLDDGGAEPNSNVQSRISSRTPSTYFNQRSQSQSHLDNCKAGAPQPMSLLELVREAKKAKEQQQTPNPPKVIRATTPAPMIQSAQSTVGVNTNVSPPQVQAQPQQQQQQQQHAPQSQKSQPLPHQQQQHITTAQFQTQQTQTPPQIPLHTNYIHSQTLPHPHHYQRRYQPQPPHHLQGEYNQRGILSAPSFASVVTASIAPNRFRNPNGGMLRTTAAGTLGRYEPGGSPPPPLSSNLRGHPLQRQNSSSCSSMDPNYDIDQWEQPRVQALKYNYQYNALRRGTHRSDYGVEV